MPGLADDIQRASAIARAGRGPPQPEHPNRMRGRCSPRVICVTPTTEIEYQSSSERMVIRQRVHPDAARALREFAAQVTGLDDAALH